MSTDQRPDVAVGHIRLDVNDVPSEFTFFVKHGMREILNRDNFAILELRGGTHLILQKADDRVETGKRTPFDLMVDDIDAAHSKYAADGLSTTPIERGNIHDSFTVTTPTGYVVPVNSSHVAGPV
ncbi:MAG: VOC family protein [Gammaproteobacteria bacterium]|nr:VOC family protein [Gammaproteobacteria bacterium]